MIGICWICFDSKHYWKFVSISILTFCHLFTFQVADTKPRSRSNSANISTKVPVSNIPTVSTKVPAADKRIKAPVKATPRRRFDSIISSHLFHLFLLIVYCRSYDLPPPAAISAADKRPITRGTSDSLPAIAQRPTSGDNKGPTATPIPAQRSNSFTGDLHPLPGIIHVNEKHSESLFGATEKHSDEPVVYVDSWDSVTQQPYW